MAATGALSELTKKLAELDSLATAGVVSAATHAAERAAIVEKSVAQATAVVRQVRERSRLARTDGTCCGCRDVLAHDLQ